MPETTPAFKAYLEEMAKNAVKKPGRGGKLEEALVGGEEAEGAGSTDKIDAEFGQEDLGIS